MVEIERKIKEMGLELPEVSTGNKTWVRCKRAGNFVYTSQTGPWQLLNRNEHHLMRGAIGRERTVEEAKELSKMCALSVLAALKNELGDLDKIDRFVKTEFYIYGIDDDNIPYPDIAASASELFVELYGENGRAAKTMNPWNGIGGTLGKFATIELAVIVYIKD
jgi:hypothetical protein